MLSPGDIENLAAVVEGTARQLAGLGEGLESRAQLAQWQGRSADAFREDMHARKLHCDGDAEALLAIATELRATAAAFRSELDALGRIESRIRTWVTDHADDVADVAGWLAGPLVLPPAGSPLWRETARTLGRLGVRF